MRPNILPTFILCAILLMEANAQEQSSSGYGAEGSTSTDDGSGFDGSGSNTQDVEKMVDAMRKLNKNKSDDELSKNIKTGARQVMHSIVEKLVTHTGKKLSKAFDNESQRKSETPGSEEATRADSVAENLDDAPEIKIPQTDVQKISAEKATEATKPESSNIDVSTDSKLRQPAPSFGQPQVAMEKNPLKETGENSTSTYASLDANKQNQESTDPGNIQKQENSQLTNQNAPTKSQLSIRNAPTESSLMPSQKSQSDSNALQVGASSENSLAAENKDQNLANNEGKTENQANAVKGMDSGQVANDEPTSQKDNGNPVSDDVSLQGVSINVENPIKDEVNSFVRNRKTAKIQPSLQTEDRNAIPQELTPEMITANTENPSDSNFRKSRKKNNQGKSKIKYRMHSHSQNTHKHKNKNTKNSQAKYFNVNKHLIKRNKANTLKQQFWTKGTNFQGPISNQLESVLNANAATSPIYTKSNFYGQNKRHYAADERGNNGNNEETDAASSGVSSGESAPNSRNEFTQSHSRKRKFSHRGRKYRNRKLSSRHRLRSQRTRSGSSALATTSRAFHSKTAKNEAATKKFKFMPFPRNLPSNNQSSENPRPITPSAATDTGSDNNESEQSNSVSIQSEQPLQMPGQSELMNSIQSQSEQPGPIQPGLQGPIPVIMLRPTSPQSEDDSPVMTMPTTSPHPIVPNIPTDQPSPPAEDDSKPTPDTDNSENVTVIAEEDNNPVQQQQQPSNQNNAVFEEVRSLESRMTVLEAAVAEVIEWIKSHSYKPFEGPPSSQVSLRPALPYPRPPSLQESSDEAPTMHEIHEEPALHEEHNPKLLKQIFIPLPPPDTEAEKELENGQPVSGLPFPINFIVSKMLAKMLKAREHQRIASHPHTPVPDINIPAIEHDINRLEKELDSVPRPLHHRHRHRFRMHRPISDDSDVRHPIIGQLVSSEPEKESPECTSTCQNGGLCVGSNVCRCPAPYTGPHCELFQPVINPTARMIMERPDERIPDSLRAAAFNRYNPSLRQKIGDHRERRRLVQVLKSMLQNLVPAIRKNSIPMEDVAPDFRSQEEGELDDPFMNQGMYQSSPDSI